MDVIVRFLGKEKRVKIKKHTVREAVKAMGISPQTVIVKRGKEIIPEEERLSEGDAIELIRVVSGG